MTTATTTELELLVMAPVAMEDDMAAGEDPSEEVDPTMADDDEDEDAEGKDEEAE